VQEVVEAGLNKRGRWVAAQMLVITTGIFLQSRKLGVVLDFEGLKRLFTGLDSG
jgi:hypothetical protein